MAMVPLDYGDITHSSSFLWSSVKLLRCCYSHSFPLSRCKDICLAKNENEH